VSYFVEIDQNAINVGRRHQRGKCAIAYAIANRYPEARHINVDRDEVRFTDSYERVRHCFKMPDNGTEFVDKWDADEPVEPFRLNLTPSLEKWNKPAKERSPRDLVRTTHVNTELPLAPRSVSPKSIATRPMKKQEAGS
jgi:hypothetical protein